MVATDIIEVRFKNSRKDFFRLPPDLDIMVGDIVAVEASPGHDIGIVSMAGEMIRIVTEEIKKSTEEVQLLKKAVTNALKLRIA